MAANEERADLGQRCAHRGEEVTNERPVGAGRHEDDSEEPARASAGHRQVVGVDDHRQPPDLRAAERDRIGRSDQDAAGNLDRASVLADTGLQPELRRRWKLGQQMGQKIDRYLPASKRLRSVFRNSYRGRD